MKFLELHGQRLSRNTFVDVWFPKRKQKSWYIDRDNWASDHDTEKWRWSRELSFTFINFTILLVSSYVDPKIRFEDFSTDKDGKRFLNIFSKGKKRYEVIYVDEETFEAVRELKEFRMQCKKQQYETKQSWWKNLKIKGWFIFPVQRFSKERDFKWI